MIENDNYEDKINEENDKNVKNILIGGIIIQNELGDGNMKNFLL